VRRVRTISAVLAASVIILASEAHVPAQATLAQGTPRETGSVAEEPTDQTAPVVFLNRTIVVLRARVLGRGPLERAETARRVLDGLAAQRLAEPVEWRPFNGGALVTVASRGAVFLSRADVDELAGESLEAAADRAVDRLRLALGEAVEAQTPRVMLRSSAAAGAALVIAVLALWGVSRARGMLARRLAVVAERTVARAGVSDVAVLRDSRLLDVVRWLGLGMAAIVDFAICYATIGFVLRRFPYSRPWGESMRRFLVDTAENLGLGFANALPGLFTVLVIVMATRFLASLVGFWFRAIERGQLRPRWIYPETAQPTRRLLNGLLWMFAIVVAYPYVPGSQTDAFKGISVFLGLMVTFGSSGLVNHIMSGFMITYSRALRVGDFVRIGDVEGTVTQLGVLSTKLLTVLHEEVTVPNAVVVAQTTTDYSRFGDAGVLTETSVTIGYDAPWRQVQSLLLLAAERTPGIRREPKPFVVQAALEDFYVKYTLLVCLDRQDARLFTLHTLHAQIQDLFNEYGVQIMSPHYLGDPAAPKVVRRGDWFAAPARPAAPGDAA